MTRLQKPRRVPQAPLPGFTSPPPARRGARGSVRLGFRRGWARGRFRPWGGVGEGVTTGRPAPAQPPPLHACAGIGGGAARYPAAPRSTPSPARGGIRFGPGLGPRGPRQPPLRSLGVPSGGPEAALAGEGEGRAAGSALSHRVLSTVTPSRPRRGGELGWREREGYPGEEAPRRHVALERALVQGCSEAEARLDQAGIVSCCLSSWNRKRLAGTFRAPLVGHTLRQVLSCAGEQN
ncbi:hypothetical protein CapIbe_013832 [Capra ibex]